MLDITRLTFVEDIIADKGVKPAKANIKAIEMMPCPHSKTEMLKFLGVVNFLGKFILNFSAKMTPLKILLKNRNEWCWNAE